MYPERVSFSSSLVACLSIIFDVDVYPLHTCAILVNVCVGVLHHSIDEDCVLCFFNRCYYLLY